MIAIGKGAETLLFFFVLEFAVLKFARLYYLIIKQFKLLPDATINVGYAVNSSSLHFEGFS